MSTDALRLADALEEKEYPPRRAAATELRRLHAENERLKAASTAQRQWLGLEQSDMPDGEDPMYDHDFFLKGMAWADAILRKKNATPTEEQPPWVGLTDEDWKQLWTEFDSLPIESDFQDHMASKYGAGYYTDADMYWQFQQQVIRQMVNAKLKEKNNG